MFSGARKDRDVKRLLLALLLATSACSDLAPATGGPDPIADSIIYGGGPFRPYQAPPTPMGTHIYGMPGGRMVNCTTIGAYTNCF